MKLVLKKINLKEETERDIESGYYDIDKFIESIKTHLKKANFLLENKILDLDEQELYDALKEVFEIKYDEQDYIDILSDVNNKHYTQIIHLNTTMVDNEGNNISCIGAATGKFKIYRDEINLTDLRKETGSSDFAIFKQVKHKLNDEYKQAEKYENMQYVSFDGDITKNKDLFESILKILRKTIKDKKVLKQILSDLQKYINELMYQAKEITKLSESDNPQVKQIGKEYKKALEENFNKKSLTQKNNHKRRY